MHKAYKLSQQHIGIKNLAATPNLGSCFGPIVVEWSPDKRHRLLTLQALKCTRLIGSLSLTILLRLRDAQCHPCHCKVLVQRQFRSECNFTCVTDPS